MNPRHMKALAVGASAAVAYLGGAKVRDAMPVRGTTLFALATVAVSAMVAARNTAVTYDTKNRLNAFLDGTQTVDGSHIHGHLNVHGDHNIDGRSRPAGGITSGGNLDMSSNNINGLSKISGGFTVDGGPIWTNGNNIYTEDGILCLRNGHIEGPGSSSWPSGSPSSQC